MLIGEDDHDEQHTHAVTLKDCVCLDLTSDDGESAVLRPRHDDRQTRRAKHQHVQEPAVWRYDQHRRFLHPRLTPFDPNPQEAHEEEDGAAEEEHDVMEEPPAPAPHWLRPLRRRQTGQSQTSDGPHEQEEERGQGDAHRKQNHAQNHSLRDKERDFNQTHSMERKTEHFYQ